MIVNQACHSSAFLILKQSNPVLLHPFFLGQRKMGKGGKGNMKNKPLAKGKFAMKTLPKGKAKAKAKAKASSSKEKPLTKGKQKNALNKKALDNLGELSLKEKVKIATEGAETAEEAVVALKKQLTPQEQQSAWGKMKTELKTDKEEAKKVAKMSKKEIGMYATMCLLKAEAPKFMACKQELTTGVSLTKGETWESELQMLQKFTKDELDLHLASGRVKWRSDPWTSGCYQYQDQGDIKKTSTVSHSNAWAWGQEYEAENEEAWDSYFSKDLNSHLLELEGKGKGKSLTKGKPGKGKGKGKGKHAQLALEDGNPNDDDEDQNDEKTEEEEWSTCLAKARKARDFLVSNQANLQEEMAKAASCQRLSKGTKKDADTLLTKAQAMEKKCKDFLLKGKKALSLTKAKGLILDATQLGKELKDQKKEISVVANKAYSKAGSLK